jgi:hypothetical protein
MLESLRNCPEDTGSPISWGDRLDTNCYIFSLFSLDYIIIKYIYQLLFEKLKLTIREVVLNSIMLISIISLGLYIYYVYIININITNMFKNNNKKEN